MRATVESILRLHAGRARVESARLSSPKGERLGTTFQQTLIATSVAAENLRRRAALVNDFVITAEMFANKVEQMPDSMFDQVFVDEKYGSYLRNIEGVIEHSYYHLGQVTLIRKMIV